MGWNRPPADQVALQGMTYQHLGQLRGVQEPVKVGAGRDARILQQVDQLLGRDLCQTYLPRLVPVGAPAPEPVVKQLLD
jgi:hypothetical protein